MIRLTWRQHRLQAGSAALLVVVLVALLLWTGHQMTAYLNSSGLSGCLATHGDCGTISLLFEHRYGGLLGYSAYLNFLPMLVGTFWGAPLVARELENGTHRLAWTQSVTRRRWLITKLALFVAAAVVAATAFSLLLSWWFHPFARVGFGGGYARMDLNVFDFQGTVPIGYTIYAFALGTAAGVFIRRTLPAMAVTLAGYVPVRLWVQTLRGSFRTPLEVSYSAFGTSPRAARGDWVLHSQVVDSVGRPVSDQDVFTICPSTPGGTKSAIGQCLTSHGFRTLDAYQPSSRFWAFQGIETGIFLGLAAVLLITAVWWVTRRTG